jgi:hypothetical protein
VLAVGLAGWLLLGGTGSAGGKDDKALLPAAEFDALVKEDAKVIEDTLAKDEPDKKMVRKVKIAAVMIAAYAQASATKDNAAQRATIRDAAIKVAKLVTDGKFKEAAELAKTLPTLKAAPGVKTAPVALDKEFGLDDLMHQFATERTGGFGIDKELGELAEEKTLTPKQVERLGSLGYRLAVVATLAPAYAESQEDKDYKGRTVKNWVAFTGEFRTAALEMAAAGRSKSEPATMKALEKVSGSCVKCHDVFR